MLHPPRASEIVRYPQAQPRTSATARKRRRLHSGWSARAWASPGGPLKPRRGRLQSVKWSPSQYAIAKLYLARRFAPLWSATSSCPMWSRGAPTRGRPCPSSRACASRPAHCWTRWRRPATPGAGPNACRSVSSRACSRSAAASWSTACTYDTLYSSYIPVEISDGSTTPCSTAEFCCLFCFLCIMPHVFGTVP